MINPSVLVIDDESTVREAVATSLRREGYEMLFAANGLEGLDLIRNEAPSVVILDLKMPVMDGFEVLHRVDPKPTDSYSVVVMTGHGDENAIQECYEAGVSFFLDKPFNAYQLRGVVKSAMAVRLLTDQLQQLVAERTDDLEQRLTEITALNRYYQEQSRELLEQIALCRRALEYREKVLRDVGYPLQNLEPFSFPEMPGRPASDTGMQNTPG